MEMENIGCGCIGTIILILVFLIICGMAYIFGWLFTLLLPIVVIVGCIIIALWVFDWIIEEIRKIFER